MEENTSIERVPRGRIELPNAVPIASYPVEVESEGGATRSLLEYWMLLQKRRWTVIGIVALSVLAVMISTLRQRPVYEASAVIQIDRESPNVLNFQDFMAEINPYDTSYLETAYQILQSRSLAYRVIKNLNLASYPEFAEKPAGNSWLHRIWQGSSPSPKPPLSPEEQLNPAYTDLINGFLLKLHINPVRRSQLVQIDYESYDPQLSARIANTVASNFIDMNLEAKWEATQKASDWLSQQLVGLKAKLEKSEEDLQRYAKENAILFLDEKQNLSSQKLQELQQEATKAQADLIQKESLYNQVKDGNFSSVPGILENKLYQDLFMKLDDLKRQYAELTSTFTPEYPKVQRLKSQIDDAQAALDQQKKSFVQRVTDDYQAAVNRKRLLDQAVAQQTKDFNDVADKSIQYNILKREADTNKQLYDGLLQRMKEAGVSAGLRASNVHVVDAAEVPTAPSKPRLAVNLLLALFVGLGLGVGLAFFQESLDSSLKTPEEVQNLLHVPTLGVIPAANSATGKLSYARRSAHKALAAAGGNGNGELRPDLITLDANTPLAEAYRSLRTSVLLSVSGRPPRLLVITSAHPGEGKTTTAVNLAITLVQLGSRVVVVDSDMRRPRIAGILGISPQAQGLSTFLTGQFPFDEVVLPTHIEGLKAVCCGPIPPNPAELLSSSSMQQFMNTACEKFDYVILDSPPVLHVSDARILASRAEAVILVAHGAVTPREAVKHAKEQLQRVSANVIGVALNNLDMNAAGYGYYHDRYYGGYESS